MKILLPLAAAFLLAACGNGETETTASDQTNAESTPPAAAAPPVAAAPAEQGRKDFGACAVCHSVREGDAARVGPNLYGVYGQPAGEREGFSYSPALSSSGLTWDDETLDAFIANPQGLVRGNRMSYPGQRDAQKRTNIIAYLKTLQSEAN